MLGVVIGAYIAISFLYSLTLKHLPYIELTVVAFGFVLRALGGAVATHVPPSGWFLTVCSLGALMVAIGKRYTELSSMGEEAIAHRPVMRWYSLGRLRAAPRAASVIMLAAYLFWALSRARPLDARLVRSQCRPAGARADPLRPPDRPRRGTPGRGPDRPGSDDDLLRAHLAVTMFAVEPVMSVLATRLQLHSRGLRKPDPRRKVAPW